MVKCVHLLVYHRQRRREKEKKEKGRDKTQLYSVRCC